jgi:hypothetical protein
MRTKPSRSRKPSRIATLSFASRFSDRAKTTTFFLSFQRARIQKKIHFSKEEEETAKEKSSTTAREREQQRQQQFEPPTRESNASISARISRGGLFGI